LIFLNEVNFKYLTALDLNFTRDLGDNCIVFENFTASIGDLMGTNWVYWWRDNGASKRIFATIKSTIKPSCLQWKSGFI